MEVRHSLKENASKAVALPLVVRDIADPLGVFDAAAYQQEAITFANTKMVTPAWYSIFLRGIGANW